MYKTIEDLNKNKDKYLKNKTSGMIVCFDSIYDIPADQETCIVYLRVSTRKASQDESIDHQYDAALHFCNNHKLFITHILFEKETATSDIMRKQYSQLESLLEKFRPNYLVAKSSDRLSRNLEGKTHLDNVLKNLNIHYAYFMDNRIVDMTDPQFQMTEDVHAMLDAYYSKQQSIKVKEYYRGKTKRCELTKQNECFGYRFDKSTRKMVINEEEAAIVRKIFEMYVFEGKGINKICNELALLGFTKIPNSRSNSKTVSPTWVSKVLKKTAYIGDMTFNHRKNVKKEGPTGITKRVDQPKENYAHAPVPAIVSTELFNLAQEIRAENAQPTAVSPKVRGGYFKGKHLFSRILFCECGASFSYKKDYRNPEKIYYFCSHNQKHKKGVCENVNHYKILEKDLEKIVLSALNEWKKNRIDANNNVLKLLQEHLNENAENHSDLELYKKNIKELEKKANHLLDLLLDNTENNLTDLYKKKLEEINNTITTLNKKIEVEQQSQSLLKQRNNRLTEIIKCLDSFAEIKTLTRDLVLKHIDKIIIHYDGTIDIYMKYGVSHAQMPLFNKEGISMSRVVETKILGVLLTLPEAYQWSQVRGLLRQ